jgi:CBS domain-containing protein
MSLRCYRMPRLVVLSPSTAVLDAARAIENNNIGAVVVQDQGRVVGIVTDRDLTVRVVGRALDPRTTPLGEVMTTPVATLAPTDSQDDALRLMQQRNIRRIPLVEAERLVGIVTSDDLLLDQAAPLDQVAAVVQGQIGEGGAAAPVRSPAARCPSPGDLRTSAQPIAGGRRSGDLRAGRDGAGSRARVAGATAHVGRGEGLDRTAPFPASDHTARVASRPGQARHAADD